MRARRARGQKSETRSENRNQKAEGGAVAPPTSGYGRPYFVMELVRGIRITDYCDQANLSTKERLDLFIKVCQAILHAHQKGINGWFPPPDFGFTFRPGFAMLRALKEL